MKPVFKRFGSAFMAMTMIASLSPMSGSLVLADETEETAPSVVSEDTEAPKETKKAEETEETAKETEAPKETEGEKIAETEKVPESSASKKAKDGPAQITDLVSAGITNGILTVKKYPNSYCDVVISGVTVKQLDFFEDDPDEYTIDLNKEIDKLIESGDIVRQSSYSVWIYAYDAELMIAKCGLTYIYDSKVPTSMNGLSAKIENGILKWKNLKGTSDIYVFINDFRCYFYSDATSLKLDEEIAWLIRSGYITKTGTYDIRIVFYSEKSKKNIASWSQKYVFNTEVTPGQKDIINFTSYSNGILSWDKIPEADEYRFIYSTPEGMEFYGFEKNEVDINDYISQLIEDGSLKAGTGYKVTIQALKYGYTDAFDDPLILAEGTYDIADFQKVANPLSISGKQATVKYKKVRRKTQKLGAYQVFAGLGTARGKLTFAKVSGNKKIKIDKNTGKVTVKKGLKKKTYSVTVTVKAAGNYGYDPSDVKKVTFKIKVK